MSSPKREPYPPEVAGPARARVTRVIDECLLARSAEPVRDSIFKAALDAHTDVPVGGSELQDFLRGPLAGALRDVLGSELATETLFELEQILDGPITRPPANSTVRPITTNSWSQSELEPEVVRVYDEVRRTWPEPLDPAVARAYEQVRHKHQRWVDMPPVVVPPSSPTLRLRSAKESDGNEWFSLAPVTPDRAPTLISKPITLLPVDRSTHPTVVSIDSRRHRR
jgi:hypothetical protein